MSEQFGNNNSPWLKNRKALNHVLFTMGLHSVSAAAASHSNGKVQDVMTLTNLVPDKTSLLSDEILLKILSRLPKSQRDSNFLVSRRWLNLQGRLVRTIKILSWEFLVSGRLFQRFPNLVSIDLVTGGLISPNKSSVSCTHKIVSCNVGSDITDKDWVFDENIVMSSDQIDRGLGVLVCGFPNLKKLAVINAGEMGIESVAEDCPTLQELELHMCNDQVLGGLAGCKNLQVLRLIGGVDWLYDPRVSDVGLMVLAQGCRRLVRLELSGCRGSYVGIRAIGQCCHMLEELILCNHKMEDGWLLALPLFENLKTLRLLSCKRIDGSSSTSPDLEMGSCPALESLQLQKCRLRDKRILTALFIGCKNVKEVVFQNCWGLTDDMFSTASILRRVRRLHLEGCSRLTTRGLEGVIVVWEKLGRLTVKWCKGIKDGAVVCGVLSGLEELKWEAADPRGIVLGNNNNNHITITGTTGMGNRGARFFRNWKPLPPRNHAAAATTLAHIS